MCLIAILIAASGVVEMARELPSAGAFYTYVTHGLGPRAGFVTGGLMFVAYALLPPAEVGLIGSYLQSTFRAEFDANIPWWLIGLVPAGLMVFLAFEGIRSSLRTALVLFTIEVAIVLAARDHHRRPRRQGRPLARAADARRLAARLQRAHDRVRVRRAELRRLRGGGHARPRVARTAPHRARAPCSSACSPSAASTCSASGPR